MKSQQNLMAEHQCVVYSVLNSVSGMSTVGSKRSDSALHGLQLEVSAERVCTQFSVLQGPELPVSSRCLDKNMPKLLTPRANHNGPESLCLCVP